MFSLLLSAELIYILVALGILVLIINNKIIDYASVIIIVLILYWLFCSYNYWVLWMQLLIISFRIPSIITKNTCLIESYQFSNCFYLLSIEFLSFHSVFPQCGIYYRFIYDFAIQSPFYTLLFSMITLVEIVLLSNYYIIIILLSF